jgi:hypothetical protein
LSIRRNSLCRLADAKSVGGRNDAAAEPDQRAPNDGASLVANRKEQTMFFGQTPTALVLADTAASPSRNRIHARVATVVAVLGLISVLLLAGNAQAAGYNYRLADGSIADVNLRCAGGSYLYYDRYASSAGIYFRSELLYAPQVRDGYGRLVWGKFQSSGVSGWNLLAAGSTFTGLTPRMGTALWALNVQFGKYVNGRFVTTSWYGADAFQSEGSSQTFNGKTCMTIF